MPSPYVKKLALELDKPISEIEKMWSKAKDITSDTFNKEEKDFGEKEYAYTAGSIRNMLGVNEDVLDPSKFLASKLSAKEFMETITSSGFPSLNKDITPPDVEKKEKVIDLEYQDDETYDEEPIEEIGKVEELIASDDISDADWVKQLDAMIEVND